MLAETQQARGRLDAAADCYERAEMLEPRRPDVLVAIATFRLSTGHPATAEELLRRAVVLDRSDPRAWDMLGLALRRQRRNDEALGAMETAVRNDTDERYGRAYVNYAVNLAETGRVDGAMTELRDGLQRVPEPYAYLVGALELLRRGDYARGWEWYEHRRLTPRFLARQVRLGKPQWNGQDLRGRTLLLRCEQGFGDTFQFIRYATEFKKKGAMVALQTFGPLVSLMRSVSGVDHVLGEGEPLPPIDYFLDLMSIPRALSLASSQISGNVPYLQPADGRHQRWRSRLRQDGMLRVGLVWAGSPTHERDRERSVPPEMLMPLVECKNVRWYSLQKSAVPGASMVGPLTPSVADLADELVDWDDTAAAIAELDLVICVDTAVAHLAGALGQPVWLLLPSRADFRWLEDRDDTRWYPTMRLFRQARPGDWVDVVSRVRTALEERVAAVQRDPGSALSRHLPTSGFAADCGEARLERLRSSPHGFLAVADTRYGLMQATPWQSDGLSLCWYGEWLHPQIQLLERLLCKGDTAIEIGAGTGAHALAIGSLMRGHGRVLALERDAFLRRVLAQNVAANALAGVVTVLSLDGDASDCALDALALPQLALLKIAGAEDAIGILEHNPDALWRLRPTVLAEAADEKALRQVAECAARYGYRCWKLSSPLFRGDNFNDRGSDIFRGEVRTAIVALPEERDVDVPMPGCEPLPTVA